jgi:hypothetical protein
MQKWNLFWSPEGRQIATVEAATMRAAIRRAPQPYRRYLGEIYAERLEDQTGETKAQRLRPAEDGL